MDQKTIDTYNALVYDYDTETIEFWDSFPRTFLNKFIDLSGEKILNEGSGPGRDGLLLKDAGKDVMCLDASEEMIKLSRERGLESVLGSFEELPFPEHSFDGVWAYTSLLHISKLKMAKGLGEVHRVLKPQGYFALGLIEGDTEEYKLSSGVSLPRLFSFYQKEEVEKLCQDAGFELVHFETFKPRSKNYLNFIFRKI